jgi:hypothetical protein
MSAERLSAEGECMNAIQLELDFRSAIALALAEPEVADLRSLWRSLEPQLLGLSQKEQLSVAGQALCDLAEVCQLRADLMWDEWVDQHNTDGPIPDEDFLAGLVQKSMFLDISGLVRQPKSRRVAMAAVEDEIESEVAEVTMETALLLAGAKEEKPEQTIALLEHDEDIAAWAKAIALWMQQQRLDRVGFVELLDGVGYPVVKGWLAVLLDEGFAMDRPECGDFYRSSGIFVALKRDEIAIAC